MPLPQRLRRFAQEWLRHIGTQGQRGSDAFSTRHRVLPQLEVLEDRLTPSGDVLAFTTSLSGLLTNARSRDITVQLQDSNGNPVAAASNVTINLSTTSSGGQFLNTLGLPLAHPSLTIPKGASSVSFDYEDSQMGLPSLQAKAPALGLSASQQELVGVWLNLGLPAQTANINPGQASQPITVELLGEYGPFVAHSDVTVQLSSSSSTGRFLDAKGNSLNKGQLIIRAGSNSASFEYKDSQASISDLKVSLDSTWMMTQMDVGTSLVFAAPAQTIKAGQPSGTITLQLQDSHGNAVINPSPMSIYLGSNSQTGQLLDSSGNPLPSFVSIPTGSSSVRFKYEDSVGGKPTLTAFSTAFQLGLSATQQETVAGPYKVVLGMPGQTIAQNEQSQPITIQLLDDTGKPATSSSAVTVQLSSSSSTGEFFDASGNPLSKGQLTIPAGSSSASFAYRDSKAGFPTLTVSENGLTSRQQVNVGVSLVFTTAAQTLKAGQPSGTITVQLQDSSGKPVAAPGILPVYLSYSSGTGQFLDSSGHSLPYPSFSIPAGSNSLSFKYEDSMGGKPTLTASVGVATGFGLFATQQETVVGPYRLLLEIPPQTISPNEPSEPFSVQLLDSTGMPAKPSSVVTVQLSSSSSTGQFLDAWGKPLSKGQLTIPAGSSSANFEYQDSQTGFPTVTASENGQMNQQPVNVGVSLAFTTPTQTLKAGQTSGTITVQLQDSNGNPFTAPNAFNVSLNSNSLTGQFLDSSGNTLPYFVSIPAGSSSFSFKYKDSMGGKPTLMASVSSMYGTQFYAIQQETVAGPYRVMFSSPQQTTTIAQNKPSQPITVQLQDSTGNGVSATSDVVVQLSSTSSTGQFLSTSGLPLMKKGQLTIRAGSSSASFEYEDSQAGFPTLTASANGFSSPTQVDVGVSLVFTTPARSFKSGQVSQPITVQLQDSRGQAVAASSTIPIWLNSSLDTVQFLGTESSLIPASTVISAGSNSATFEITSNWGGTPTLTASTFGMLPATTQQENIQGLSGLVFKTTPQTLAAGQMSQPVTLQLVDSNGKPAVAPSGGLMIILSGNPVSFQNNPIVQFFAANGKPLRTMGAPFFNGSVLTMPAGSSTVSFEFQTTKAGSLPLVAEIYNGPTTKQVETIQAGPPHALVFQTPAQTLPVGTPTGSITVQLVDQYGNPISAGSGGLTFNLHSSSSGGTFLSADGDPLAGSKITLPQGLSSATFEYKDSQAGTPTLTASANGFSATQKEAIVPVSAEIHVTNTKDSGSGSLRAAIEAANANSGSTIVFDPAVKGTIDLLSALPDITANTNILGPGANLLTIERSAAASTNFGIFQVGGVFDTVQPIVVLSGLTVANGTGTGITNLGYLTLQRMVVRDNRAAAISGPGMGLFFPFATSGGIENTGTLTVLNSTIAHNSSKGALAAAGIDSENGSVLILNSTIAGNTNQFSRSAGIGIYGGTALIESSTISGNTITGQWTGGSGGIDSDGQVTLYDTLVAGNTGSVNNPADVSGAFISLGHNLIGMANQQSSGFVGSDLVGTPATPIDPKLGALGSNGGATPTLALLTGSPAIGAGNSANAPATDQRGDPRPQGAIDIGAFEWTTG